MSRRKIEHRLFKRGQPLRVPLNKDTAGSGSVEIKHLDFTTTTSNLVDLNDADVIAVRDTSDSSMKAVKLGALKAYVSGSQATGRSGSIQFNVGGDFGGALTFTTDGTHMTASAKNNPGTYIFRLTSGSIKAAGHTYGPANGNIPQYLEVASSGSERYLFFPSDGTSTTKPTARSLNLELDRADSEYREVRIEAKAGITDWRDVADNFFEQMKLELETRAGLATITSSSAGSITATASITVAYSTLGGGCAVGGGKFTNLGSPTVTHRLRQPAGFTPGGDNASSADVPLANNAGQNKNGPGNEPANTGVFVESSVSGSSPSNAAIYFTNGALGVSPKHQKIVSNAAGVIEIQATATGSGQVDLKGGKGVNIRTVSNKGFIFDVLGTNPILKDGRDSDTLQRSNIQFRTLSILGNPEPVVTLASGSTRIFETVPIATSASAGTYVLRFTSGSVRSNVSGKNSGGANPHLSTYAPLSNTKGQLVAVRSTGSNNSEYYIFYLSGSGVGAPQSPLPVSASINLDFSDLNPGKKRHDIPVEAFNGVQDWRTVVTNLKNAMISELQHSASLATITYQAAANINATASITIAYAPGKPADGGGVQIGHGGNTNASGRGQFTTTLASALFPASDPAAPIEAAGAGQNHDNKVAGTPDQSGGTVEIQTSGSSASTANNIRLIQNNAKLYFNNGTTFHVGQSTNVQYLTASQAKFETLDVEEIVSRSTTKESLEINDKLIIAAVSGSKHANFVGAGFQVGGKTAAQGTGSAALISMTLGDPLLNQGSMIMKVNDTRIASITSGSFFTDSTTVADSNGILAVTGAISASYARAQSVDAKLVSGSALTVQRLVTNKIAGDGIVTVDNIKTGSVATGHFADAAVTHAKIAVGAVRPDNLDTGSILTAHITDAQVTHAKLAVGAVRPDNLDTGSILTAHITDGQVTHAKLATGALTADNIQTGSVNAAHLVAGSVTHVKLATGAIKNDNISTGSVEHDHLATGAITSDNIQTGSINTAHIAAAAVTHAKLATGAVTADNIQTGSVNTAHIADAAVTHAKFGVGSVRPDNLDTGSILTAHITDAQVTHAKLAVGAVTLDNLDTGSVLTAHVGAGQVTHAKLSQTKAGSGNTILDFSGFSNFGLGSFSAGETLKIGDGTRVLTFTGVDAEGGNATGSLDFGVGSDRDTTVVVTELSTKINNSALNAIAQRSGTSITLTPSASVTLTVQEDPSPGNGVFGSAAGNLVVTLSSPATEAAITADNLQTGSVDAGQLVAGSVTTDKFAPASVTGGTFRLFFTSGSVRSNVSGKNSGGANPHLSTYAPLSNTKGQLVAVRSTGSAGKKYYLFYLSGSGVGAPQSPLPVSGGINLNFSDLNPGKLRHDIPVEAFNGIQDWRDVVTNLKNKMIAELQHSASLATITYNAAANINATASITIAYAAGVSHPGRVQIGHGGITNASGRGEFTTTDSALFAASDPLAPLEQQIGSGNHDNKASGTPDNSGGKIRIITSGSAVNAPVRRDNFDTGSIEHNHLNGAVFDSTNFTNTSVNTPHLADGSVSIDKLATGSVSGNQLNQELVRNGSDSHGGLQIKNQPGTYVIRLTSGSVGRFGNKTYGPVNNTAQLIQCVGTGSSDFMFFLSNGGSTNAPSAQSVNFLGTAQEIRVEAHTGVTDWRDVAGNFFEKMKAQLDTNTGIATVTSSSAANVKGTASITVAYNSLGGGVRVGSGRNGSRNFHIAHSMPVSTAPFNASTDPSSGLSPIQTGGSSGQSGEPTFNGGFPETITSGSDANLLKISFVRKDFGRSGNKFISNVMGSPFTTASLGAQPMSGTLEVYFNGVLLLGDHPKANAGGPTQADYRLVTASANAYQVRLNEELALDSDDILTITFYSGSNPV